MVPGDRLFCTFVENHRINDWFTDWPLHATIVPWFRIDISSKDLGRALRESLPRKLTPFKAAVDGETKFGRRRKLVSLLRTPSPLQTIEYETRELLHECGAWLVDESTKKHRNYRPHVTAQKSARLHTGDTFLVDAIYIVEQKGDHKEVVGRISL